MERIYSACKAPLQQLIVNVGNIETYIEPVQKYIQEARDCLTCKKQCINVTHCKSKIHK